MKRILITGVTGFVGTNLVTHFHNQGDYMLFGHSRNAEKARAQFQNAKVEIIDRLSAATLNDLKIDYLIHLAGIAHDLSSQYQTEDYFRVNYGDTKKIYDEFLQSNASKFIFLSSIKAVADHAHAPLTEETTPHPLTDYGKSKLKAEQYIQSKMNVPGKGAFTFRPCMIHGPGNKGNLNLLYRFVKRGIPFPLAAFENRRSFLSIDNFSFIVQRVLENQILPGTYHLADDGHLSTKDLYALIASAIGKKPRIWNVPRVIVRAAAALAGKKNMLNKLTEDYVVSNKKLLHSLNGKLPLALRDGLGKTIKSFRE